GAPLPEPRKILEHSLDPARHALAIGLDVSAHHEILFRGQMLEHPATFEDLDHAAPDHLVGRQAVDALAGQLDVALGHFAALGAEHARHRLERRGLAGTVRSEEGGDSAFTHFERHPLEHEDDAVVDHLDVFQVQHVHVASEGGDAPSDALLRGSRYLAAASLVCLAITSG